MNKFKQLIIKKEFGVDNLHFAFDTRGRFQCRYISDEYNFEPEIQDDELVFILRALSAGQGQVIFTDTNEICKGMGELRNRYLLFKLAQL